MAVIARCPHCDTSFRVTPKQMKAKSGKVRCGSCKAVFNVLEHLIEDSPDSVAPRLELQWPEEIHRALAKSAAEDKGADGALPDTGDREVTGPAGAESGGGAARLAAPPETPLAHQGETPALAAVAAADAAADDVGLAVRELRTAPSYNRWAESPLSSGSVSIAPPKRELSPTARVLWPVVGLLAIVALALQGAYHWRTELAVQMPSTRPFLQALCAQFHCRIDLPRETAQVAIESSTLQSDPARPGLVLLDATLRNAGAYAQAFPHLELTLTDAADRPLIRRALAPEDYLNEAEATLQGRVQRGLPGLGELNLRLWIDVSEVGATGYRLYLFYP
jgi:predicted Zn finger-like uncharacterized protein